MVTPEEMWERFEKFLANKEPLGKPDKNGVLPPHKNVIGSIEKYKRIFLEANKPE